MNNPDTVKYKLSLLAISLLFMSLNFFLFWVDQKSNWKIQIIIICAVTSYWAFFVIPAYRYYSLQVKLYKKDKENQPLWKDFELLLPAVLAPWYGLKYYFYPRISKIL